MGVAFWVYISTVLFLAIIVLKSRKFIVDYFANQQKEIVKELSEADEVLQKAQSLYEEYREKMETLDVEADHILKEADATSKEILNNTQEIVDKIIAKKEQEFLRRIEGHKQHITQELLYKYSDVVSAALQNDAIAQNYSFVYSNSFSDK